MKKLDRNDPHTRRILTAAAFFLILVIGMVYSFQREEGSDVTHLSFHTGGYFTVVDDRLNRTNIFYNEISEAVFLPSPDYGEPAGGAIQDGMRLGQWQSAELGPYENCTDLDITACVLVKTTSGTYAVNIESNDTTKALYQAILKEMDKAPEEK